MTDREAATRRALMRLGTAWPNGWTRDLNDEYARALGDVNPRILDDAVSDAIATRAVRPMPNQLRELVEHRLDEEARRQAAGDIGPGAGCPRCATDHGPGPQPWWIPTPEQHLVSCPQHRWSWRGTLPARPDPGDLPADVWRHLALRGDYGAVIRDAAQRGATPNTPIKLPVKPVDQAIRDERHTA